MSVCFVVAPAVVVGWPFAVAAASAAAAQLGYVALKSGELEMASVKESTPGVELPVAHSEVLTEQVALDDELLFTRGDLVVRIYKDARGQCAIHVHGEGRTRSDLREEGQRLIDKITQQFVYQKVTRELEERGFAIAGQSVSEEGHIHLRLRKFE